MRPSVYILLRLVLLAQTHRLKVDLNNTIRQTVYRRINPGHEDMLMIWAVQTSRRIERLAAPPRRHALRQAADREYPSKCRLEHHLAV